MKPKSSSWYAQGEFYPDTVVCHINGHQKRLRILCFARWVAGNRSVVGASAKFNHGEAFEKARLAAEGMLPVPATNTVEDTLTVALRLRGFPVSSPDFELSDRTAKLLTEEFCTP